MKKNSRNILNRLYRFHRFSRKSTSSIWKYVNYHCIIDFFVLIIDNSKWNYYCCNAQILNLKWWFFFLSLSSYHGKGRSFHAKLYPGEPLQAGDGTKKFLFHSMIVMICCKRTSCVLIFMFNEKEFLTMQNVFKVYDYQTCLSIKPRIILQVFFFTFLRELSLNYLSILIFSALISPTDRITFK